MTKKIPQKTITLFLLLAMCLAVFFTVPSPLFAAEGEDGQPWDIFGPEDAEYVEKDPYYEYVPFDYADDSRLGEIRQITVPFYGYLDHYYQYDFPYTDDFFRYPSDAFSRIMAQASMGLAVSAFRNEGLDIEDQFTTYLSAAGFSDIYTFGYDKPTSKDSLSGLIAHKKIDDFTVIACSPCGQGYGKEWGGNLEVGTRVRHTGFNNGADVFKEQIAAYLEKYKLTGKLKVWVTGFSRASAVANLTAADLYKSGRYEDVYAYLFGVPRTTRTPLMIEGIYNICGQYDPVTNVPLYSWTYGRYGKDVFTPAQESDSNYSVLSKKASEVHREIAGGPFRNNPEINHQIRTLLDFMSELFPETDDYVENMQDIIMKLWTESNPDQILEILTAAMKEFEKTEQREAGTAKAFFAYASLIASEHLSGNRRQKNEGSWDPNAGLGENLLREHLPLTYISWLFADCPAEELFKERTECRRVMINGSVDVDVYCGDVFVNSVSQKGKVISADLLQDGHTESLPNLSVMRLGRVTTLNLPADRDYRIVLHTDALGTLLIDDLLILSGSQKDIGNYNVIYTLDKGTYELFYEDALSQPALTATEGTIISEFADFYTNNSAASRMEEESASTEHLTAESLVLRIYFILAVLLLSGIICLIIAIVHARKKKKGHPPYSPWWVIIPHLFLIAFFATLTIYVIDALVMIGILISAASTLTLLFIFLLALRALLRKKCLPNLIVAGGILVLGVLNWFFFAKTFFADQSVRSFVIYAVLIVLLSIAALSGFFRKEPAET